MSTPYQASTCDSSSRSHAEQNLTRFLPKHNSHSGDRGSCSSNNYRTKSVRGPRSGGHGEGASQGSQAFLRAQWGELKGEWVRKRRDPSSQEAGPAVQRPSGRREHGGQIQSEVLCVWRTIRRSRWERRLQGQVLLTAMGSEAHVRVTGSLKKAGSIERG